MAIRTAAAALAMMAAAAAGPTGDYARAGEAGGGDIVTVRAVGEAEATKQGLSRFHGISGKTAGARAISLHMVRIPPGGAAKAHIHKGYETAIYLLKGRVETRYGAGLKKRVVNEAGDFIYIPSDVPHQPFNLSETKWAEAIVARTDPNEQESVVPYPAGGGETAR